MIYFSFPLLLLFSLCFLPFIFLFSIYFLFLFFSHNSKLRDQRQEFHTNKQTKIEP
jgi:hypothetical protein